MIELEAKIAIDDFGDVKLRLSVARAQAMGHYAETNTFFDTPDRRLLAADKGLRLRRQRDLENDTDKFILTFKGSNQPGEMKKREERELVVESDSHARALLQSLGYEQIFQFEKRREVWTLDHCEIALDEIRGLGRFVEIEGPSETAIEQLIERLGLEGKILLRESYVALLMEKQRGE